MPSVRVALDRINWSDPQRGPNIRSVTNFDPVTLCSVTLQVTPLANRLLGEVVEALTRDHFNQTGGEV